MKMLIEELMKQVRDKIKQSCEEIVVNFVVHSKAIQKRVSELEVADQVQDDRVSGLESVAAVFDKSFKA
jgi:transcriptional regulator CtsR